MANNTLVDTRLLSDSRPDPYMNTLLSRYRQRIEQAAMQNARTNYIPMPPGWMKNSSNNSVMGKIDTTDPYAIEQARNANPTANEEAGLEMPMLADPYNYVGLGLGAGAANAMRKFVAPKANQTLKSALPSFLDKKGERFTMHLDEPEGILSVQDSDGLPVAVTKWESDKPTFPADMWVDEYYRRRGINTAMQDFMANNYPGYDARNAVHSKEGALFAKTYTPKLTGTE